MDVFTSAPHDDVLVLVLRVAILLFTARAMGEIAQRLKQPAVIGEILAGILLGPSILSGFVPSLEAWIIPQTEVEGYLLEVVSLFGAMFLLLITGLETDLTLIKRHARTAISVSYGGILTTFSTGYLLGMYLPDSLLADPDRRIVFALFVATAMSISAIPVIAKVLMDLNLMRRDIGQTIIAAGMSDDTTGWILLSVVAGLASGQSVTVGSVVQTVGSVIAFLVISFTLGRYIVKKLLDYVQDEVISTDRLLTLVVVLTFTWGALTQALHLEAVLGAFIMGVILGQMPRLPDSVHKKLESIALGVFAPVFFAVAGLKVNVRNLLETELIILCLIVIFVACAGKIAGTYVGARFVGRKDHWNSLSFGAGLNARGAMEIIIASIGLSLGILSQDMFSIIVVMAMVTSLMAPPALRFVLSHVEPDEQEKKRLKKEELAKDSKVAAIYRVLLPVRLRVDGDNVIQTIESSVLEKMGQNSPLSVTLLCVVKPGEKEAGTGFLNELAKLFNQHEIVKKVVESKDPADIILEEADKDYDLLLLGSSEEDHESDVLFTPLVDYLIRLAPCMTMVVHGERLKENWTPSRILVPTNGSMASKTASEVGFMVASSENDEVTILNVVEDDLTEWHIDIVTRELKERRLGYAHQVVEQLRKIGESQGVLTVADVRAGSTVEDAISKVVRKERIDLVILGTRVRAGTEKLFMGPKVEKILKTAGCPVIVVNY